MSTFYLLAVIITSGVCGIVSAFLLRNRQAVKWQGMVLALALIAGFLVGGSDEVKVALTVAAISWILHVAATYAVLRR